MEVIGCPTDWDWVGRVVARYKAEIEERARKAYCSATPRQVEFLPGMPRRERRAIARANRKATP